MDTAINGQRSVGAAAVRPPDGAPPRSGFPDVSSSDRVSTRKNADWAEIRIQDTGGGIAENIKDRIFDPFFTTKEVGKGTGQGLAIAHDVIVNKHHGTITVDSHPPIGTTFIIRFPLEVACVDAAA
jgi:signal transduction histidine kinase